MANELHNMYKGAIVMDNNDYREVMFDNGFTTALRNSVIKPYEYSYVRHAMGLEWSDYDCKIITQALTKYTANRELQYLMNRHRCNFRTAVEKLVDTGIIKMY